MKSYFFNVTFKYFDKSLTDENKGQSDDECECVRSEWLLAFSISFGKEVQIRKEFITAKCLKDFGRRDETCEGRAKGRSEAAGVVQWSESRY